MAKKKELTASQVICRITGCGQANAAEILSRLDMKPDEIVAEYHAGPEAVQRMLARIQNKPRPPRDFKTKPPTEQAPPKP